jgi:hypothetical protein
MRQQCLLEDVVAFVATVALVDVTTFTLVALVCWFTGWRTLEHYGTGLTLAGALIIAAGGSALVGPLGAGRTVQFRYGNLAHLAAYGSHAGQFVKNMYQSYAFLILAGTAGTIAILFGEVIRTALAI